MIIVILRRGIYLGLFLLTISFCSRNNAQASEDIFHIFSPVIEKGGWGAEVLSAYQDGLPNGVNAERVKFANEFAVHADITDYWMGKLLLGTVQEVGDNYKITDVGFENVFRADKWTLKKFDAAWFTGIYAATDDAATNAVEFGPIISYFDGPISVILNPFLEKTFGQNKEEGIALTYAWRSTYQIVEKFSIGLEGYGFVENLGNSPALNDQVHRVGPVLYFGHVHGNPENHSSPYHHEHSLQSDHEHSDSIGELSADLGVLFGLTENTSDIALKGNTYVHF